MSTPTTPKPRRDVDALERAIDAGRRRVGRVQPPAVPLNSDALGIADDLDDLAGRLTLGERVLPESLAPVLSAAALMLRAVHDASTITEAVDALSAVASTIPTARATDPETSRNAAPKPPRRGTQAGRLLVEIARDRVPGGPYPYGMTSEEAADEAEGVSLRSEYAKRCSDLATLGLIEDTGVTRPGRSGHQRIVYRATRAGYDLAEKIAEEDRGRRAGEVR